MTDFGEEGFSATIVFSSDDMDEGSMTTYLTRGMVSTKQLCCRIGAYISELLLSRGIQHGPGSVTSKIFTSLNLDKYLGALVLQQIRHKTTIRTGRRTYLKSPTVRTCFARIFATPLFSVAELRTDRRRMTSWNFLTVCLVLEVTRPFCATYREDT